MLAFELAQPSAEVAAALQLKSEEQILRLRRIPLADAVSVCVETMHLPCKLFPDLLSRLDPAQFLYATLSQLYGTQVDHADEVAEASVHVRGREAFAHTSQGSGVPIHADVPFVGWHARGVREVGLSGDRCKVVSRLTRKSRIEEEGVQ